MHQIKRKPLRCQNVTIILKINYSTEHLRKNNNIEKI